MTSAPRQEPEFRPEQGSAVDKSIETKFEIERGRMEVEFPGSEALILDDRPRLFVGQSLVFRDEYEAVDEGRVEELHRCLERLEIRIESEVPPAALSFEGASKTTQGRGEVEGACIVFAREPASSEFEVAYAEADRHRDEELIQGLEADMDFQALLPGREVAPGDRWTTRGSVIAELLFPGGRLPFALEDGDPRDRLGDLRELVGDLEVEFYGIATRGGDDLAELRVHGKVEGVTCWMEEVEEYPLMFFAPPARVDRTAETCCTLRGELLWNLDLGRFDSASFEGDVDLGFVEVADIEGFGELRLTSGWRGSFSLQATAEEPEE